VTPAGLAVAELVELAEAVLIDDLCQSAVGMLGREGVDVVEAIFQLEAA